MQSSTISKTPKHGTVELVVIELDSVNFAIVELWQKTGMRSFGINSPNMLKVLTFGRPENAT